MEKTYEKGEYSFGVKVAVRSVREVKNGEPMFEFQEKLKIGLKVDNSGAVPQFVLTTGGDMVAGEEQLPYACMVDTADCALFKDKLFNGGFAKAVMPFEDGNFFDQPSAVRQMLGLIQNINHYAQNVASQSMFQIDEERIVTALNCGNNEIKKAKEMKVSRNKFEIGLSQNFLDFANLEYFQVESDNVVNYALEKFKVDDKVKKQLTDFGLLSIKNHLGPVQNKEILDKINYNYLQKPIFTLA